MLGQKSLQRSYQPFSKSTNEDRNLRTIIVGLRNPISGGSKPYVMHMPSEESIVQMLIAFKSCTQHLSAFVRPDMLKVLWKHFP